MHLQGHARLLCGWASAVGRLLTSTASPTQSALWASQTLGQLRYISTPADSALHSMGLEPWTGYQAGIEKAVTLPASWYTQPAALQLEKMHVLYNSWQMVCATSRVQQPGDYVCGQLGDVRYLLVRGQDGQLRAFHNVCRHHAAAVAQGCGNQASMQFACPYHGWTYDTRGRLVKATRLKGIQDFKAGAFGLHPIAVDTWGHFVFLHLQGGGPVGQGAAAQAPLGVAEWLGAGCERMHALGMADSSLVHITRKEYVLNCNWKVFADNYLDGGYHVPYAHKDLSSGLDLSGYTNELHEVMSIQTCSTQQQQQQQPQQPAAAGSTGSIGSNSSTGMELSSIGSTNSKGNSATDQLNRLAGRDAAYAFVFPTLMVNRYGSWMDTNVVMPLNGKDVDRCRVVFDYWLDEGALLQAAASSTSSSGTAAAAEVGAAGLSTGHGLPGSAAIVQAALQSQFVQDSLASSHQVQVEDIALCEAVQQGLQEPSYGVGRYAPGPEAPMYHFHSLMYAAVNKHLAAAA